MGQIVNLSQVLPNLLIRKEKLRMNDLSSKIVPWVVVGIITFVFVYFIRYKMRETGKVTRVSNQQKGLGAIIKAVGKLVIATGVIFFALGLIGFYLNMPLTVQNSDDVFAQMNIGLNNTGRKLNQVKADKRLFTGIVIMAIGGGIIWVSTKANEK